MRREWNKLILIAGLLLLAAGAALFAWSRFPWLSSPTYGLKLAVGPSSIDEGPKFFAAFVREVAEEHPFVRFRAFPTESWDAAGRALLDSSADLAMLRGDDPATGQGRTLIILRKLVAVFLADSKSKVENPRELSGKKIGVLEGARDDRLVKAIIEFFGFPSSSVIEIPPADAGKAIRDNRVAALLVVGPVGPGPLRDAITAVRKATKGEPSFLDIEEAETFAKRYPVYETMEIAKGAFGGAALEPTEAVNTVAVSVRLVSRASLGNRAAGELTRMILATKAKLAASMPGVDQIEAPDTDEVSVLPLHPGAVTYLKGEQKSLYELVSDNVFTIMFAGGLVASVAGWTFGLFRSRKPDESEFALARLSELRRKVAAGTLQPDEVERELEDIAGRLADLLIAQTLEPARFVAASTIIEQIRRRGSAGAQRQPIVASQLAPPAVSG